MGRGEEAGSVQGRRWHCKRRCGCVGRGRRRSARGVPSAGTTQPRAPVAGGVALGRHHDLEAAAQGGEGEGHARGQPVLVDLNPRRADVAHSVPRLQRRHHLVPAGQQRRTGCAPSLQDAARTRGGRMGAAPPPPPAAPACAPVHAFPGEAVVCPAHAVGQALHDGHVVAAGAGQGRGRGGAALGALGRRRQRPCMHARFQSL